MKMQIRSQRNVMNYIYWTVDIDGDVTTYADVEAAYKSAAKRFKRYYKESAAFSMLSKVSANLCTIDEWEFIKKIRRTKCKGITPKQYGYLKGIYERQERAW